MAELTELTEDAKEQFEPGDSRKASAMDSLETLIRHPAVTEIKFVKALEVPHALTHTADGGLAPRIRHSLQVKVGDVNKADHKPDHWLEAAFCLAPSGFDPGLEAIRVLDDEVQERLKKP